MNKQYECPYLDCAILFEVSSGTPIVCPVCGRVLSIDENNLSSDVYRVPDATAVSSAVWSSDYTREWYPKHSISWDVVYDFTY